MALSFIVNYETDNSKNVLNCWQFPLTKWFRCTVSSNIMYICSKLLTISLLNDSNSIEFLILCTCEWMKLSFIINNETDDNENVLNC